MTNEKKKEITEMVKNDSNWLKTITSFLLSVCETELQAVKNNLDDDFYEELKEEDECFEEISDKMLKKLVNLTTQKFIENFESELFDSPYGTIPALSESEFVDRENEKWRKKHPKKAVCHEKMEAKEKNNTSISRENCEIYLKNNSCKGCEYNVDYNEQPLEL